MARPKIFCIGFHKTGTTSLYAALVELGLKVTGTIGHRLTADALRCEGALLCIRTMARYDAAEDMPWPLFFRELDAAFPGAKFVLTVREPDPWFASIDRHFGDVDSQMHRFVYGAAHGRARDNREPWIAVKSAHEDAVRAHFSHRPRDLLVMDLATGDGWAALAPFLGVPVPATPFPVKNQSADRLRLSYRLKKKLNEVVGRTPHPERLV